MTKNKIIITCLLAIIVSVFVFVIISSTNKVKAAINMSIARMDNLPSVAEDYEYKDWKETTINYINYILDESSVFNGMSAKGESLADKPIKIVQSNAAKNIDAFFNESGNKFWGIKSYLGLSGGGVEGINCIAAILSGTQVGLDMTNYSVNGQEPHNYVRDMVAFYQAENGQNVVLNSASASTGGSFWYELLPGCLFVNLYEYYPEETYLKEIIAEMSKKWMKCVDDLGGANCDFSSGYGYSIAKGEQTFGNWREPDAAAGLAYILYGGYKTTENDPVYGEYSSQFLTRAMWCMDFLDRLEYSPFYEVLTFLAPPIAVKLNAFHNKNYDIAKYINWTLDGSSAVRGGWGMINESWGGKHTYGLMGSLSDGGGYAFAMNTFDAAWGFIPTVKYDTRFANSIGKWILNVTNASRYFYGKYSSDEGEYITNTYGDKSYTHWSGYYQSSNYFAPTDSEASFIAYEGLRKYQKGFNWNADGNSKSNFTNYSHSPYASGDSFTYAWGGNTDYGMYGSSHVGMFGATIDKTNVSQILKVDLNALDYFGEETYPTYMFYNPYNQAKEIEYTKENASNRLYDAINKTWITTTGSGKNVKFYAPAGVSTIIVELPIEGEVTTSGGVYYLDGKYVTSSRSSLNMTVEHLEDDSWNEIGSGAVIRNRLRIYLDAQVDSSTTLKEITVTINGKEVYKTTQTPTTYIEIDVENNDLIRSGNGSIIANMKLNNGALEKRSIGITVAKSRLETAVEFETNDKQTESFAKTIETWNSGPNAALLPFDCSVETVSNGTKITASNALSYGSSFTEYFRIDLSRTPVLELNIQETTASWALKVFIEDGDATGYYMIRDIDVTGKQSVNIMEQILIEDRAFDLTGIHNLAVWILPAGKPGCSVTVSDIYIYYLYDSPIVTEPNQYEWGFNFNPGYINIWGSYEENLPTSGANLEYTNNATEMLSIQDGKDSAYVASPFIYADIAKNPVVSVKPYSVTGKYSIGVLFEGDPMIYELVSDIPNDKEQVFSIPQTMKTLYPNKTKSGMSNIKIVIILEEDGSSVELALVKTYYQLTNWGTTISGTMFDDWGGVVNDLNKGTITPVGNAQEDYKIENPDNESNSTSSRGAAGKFELNLDRNPELSISIADVQGKWSASVVFFGDLSKRYEIIPQNTSKNVQKRVNLLDAILAIDPTFNLSGVQSVYLQVEVVGGGNYACIRKVQTTYNKVAPKFEDGYSYSDRSITSWDIDQSLNTLSYLKGNVAILEENLKGSSLITTPQVKLTTSKNPQITISCEIKGTLRVYANIQGQRYQLSPKNGYTTSGIINIDVNERLTAAGFNITNFNQNVTFSFEADGANSKIGFEYIKFINKLASVGKITVNGNELSWDRVPGAENYSVVIYDSSDNVVQNIASYVSNLYDVSSLTLPDGIYRIVVTAQSSKSLPSEASSQGFKQGNVESIPLAKVDSISYNGMFIRFDSVDNAQGYQITLKDVDTNEVVLDTQIIMTNYIDLSSIGLSGFNYSLTINAKGDDVAYLSSDANTFNFATPTQARYTPKVLATATSVNNDAFITVTSDDIALLQLPTGGNWGEVGTSAFYLNMSANPIWYIDFGNVTHGYYMRMYIDGTLYYITDNVFSSETCWFDLVGILTERGEAPASALTGNHLVRFCFGVTGGTADVVNPTVEIIESRVFTMSDGYIQPIIGELNSPVLRVDNKSVAWDNVEHAQQYVITVFNEFGLLYSETVSTTNIDLSFLVQPDTYTVNVFSRGQNYYDSELSTIEYVVTETVEPVTPKKGCKSMISTNLFLLLSFVAIPVFISRKKKYLRGE